MSTKKATQWMTFFGTWSGGSLAAATDPKVPLMPERYLAFPMAK